MSATTDAPAPADDRIHAVVFTKRRLVHFYQAEKFQDNWDYRYLKKLTLSGCVLYSYEHLGDPSRFPSDLPDRLRELQRLRQAMDTTPGGWNPKSPVCRAHHDYQLALVMELAGTPLRRSARLRRA